MRARRALLGSLGRSPSHLFQGSSRRTSRFRADEYRHAQASRHFSSTRPDAFAFKWFRKPRDEALERRRAWEDILHRRWKSGEITTKEAAECTELLVSTTDKLAWLDDESLLLTLRIVLRSNSLQHTELVARLYALVLARRELDPKSALTSQAMLSFHEELAGALAIAGRDRDAMTLCLDLMPIHNQPLRMWKALLLTYRDVGNLMGFLQVREFMSTHRIEADVHILNLQLEMLSANKLFADAQAIYKTMPGTYQVAHNWQTRVIMLRACMSAPVRLHADDQGRLELGQEIYSIMEGIDLEEHAEDIYATLLSWVVYSGGNIDTVLEMVRDMKKKYDIALNIIHINSMLFAAHSAEQWLMVERLWKSLERTSIYPTSETFSLRIAASVLAGDRSSAKDIFEASKSAGYTDMLDSSSLQTLLAAEMMAKDSDDALTLHILQLLEKMTPFPITPTSLEFLIPKLMEKKHFQALENILERSMDRDDWNAARTIDLILEQLQDAQDSKSVWNNFILLRNLFWDDPAYTLPSRRRLLQRLIELREPRVIGQMFSQFLKSRVRPDESTYIHVLQGAKDLRDYELIRRVHQFMKMDMHIAEHAAVLNTLMNAYAHVHSSLTFDIWEQIFRSGRGPTNASVSIVLDGCAFGRVPNKGRLIWASLERRGFPFNDNNYASYVEMLNRHAQTDEAMEFLQRAIEQGKQVRGRAVSTLYNTTNRKEQVAAWANKTCPVVWNELKH